MKKLLTIFILGAGIFWGFSLYACGMMGMMGGGNGGHADHGSPAGGNIDHNSPGMTGPSGQHQAHNQQPVSTAEQAAAVLNTYLQSTKNPNLALGTISESDHYFEADILTKEGALVDKIRVDKHSGALQSAYAQEG